LFSLYENEILGDITELTLVETKIKTSETLLAELKTATASSEVITPKIIVGIHIFIKDNMDGRWSFFASLIKLIFKSLLLSLSSKALKQKGFNRKTIMGIIIDIIYIKLMIRTSFNESNIHMPIKINKMSCGKMEIKNVAACGFLMPSK
jgi:hypothetical protein